MRREGPENPYATGIFGTTAFQIIYRRGRRRKYVARARFCATHQHVGKNSFHVVRALPAHFSRDAARMTP
jgi:hypothetical protein